MVNGTKGDPAMPVAYRVDWPAEAGIGRPRFFGADDEQRMRLIVKCGSDFKPKVVPLFTVVPEPTLRERLRRGLQGDAVSTNEHIEALRNIAEGLRAYAGQPGDDALTANRIDARLDSLETEMEKPIDMVLYCPACLEQHIDEPERSLGPGNTERLDWDNPPHKSHLCHHCGHQWRPADVPTNGVLRTKTHGKNDMVLLNEPAEELRSLRLARELQNPPKLEWDGGAP